MKELLQKVQTVVDLKDSKKENVGTWRDTEDLKLIEKSEIVSNILVVSES